MAIMDGRENLSEKASGFFFLDPLVCNDVIKQLASVGMLHYDVDLLGSLDYIVDLDDVRMVEKFKKFNLSLQPIHLLLGF